MTQYIMYLWHCIKLYYYVRLWDWKTPSFLKLHPCHAVQTLSSWSKSSSVTIWIKLCGITFSWCCLCFGHLRSKIHFKNLKSFVLNFDFGVCVCYTSAPQFLFGLCNLIFCVSGHTCMCSIVINKVFFRKICFFIYWPAIFVEFS